MEQLNLIYNTLNYIYRLILSGYRFIFRLSSRRSGYSFFVCLYELFDNTLWFVS